VPRVRDFALRRQSRDSEIVVLHVYVGSDIASRESYVRPFDATAGFIDERCYLGVHDGCDVRRAQKPHD
jgi:hypothetical protein